jgi:LPS export ABC transporter protein LptC
VAASRNFLWIFPLIFLVTGPAWKPFVVAFLLPPESFSPAQTTERTTGGFSMTGVTVTRSAKGAPESILSAEKVESGRWDENDYSMKQVDAQLFDQGKLRAHVISGEGYYDVSQKILTLIDDVSVTVQDEYELTTQALRYLLPYKIVKTGADILFESRDMRIQGKGMRYNLATGDYRVGGRVRFDIE